MSKIESDKTAINNSIASLQKHRKVARATLKEAELEVARLKRELVGYSHAIKWREEKWREL
ncbi:MAG: hypothetical protein DRQ39_03525 [Gammaproteobacteria bacterium]|nr:MAG: hypothetical protein DRQ39_03525 [Gammaproteobacteria bacterium]